jgi:hypothetical protein
MTTTCSLQVVIGKHYPITLVCSHKCVDLQNALLNIRHNPETVCGASSSKAASHLNGDFQFTRSNPLEME